MRKLEINELKDVFEYFEDICNIPHGSGNTEKISKYCMDFAEKNGLHAECDEAGNVIIYKPATEGFEAKEPIILQGHLDMVCQKDEGVGIDFENDGLDIYTDGDYIKARGTTLGADNGIAVAMIMSILARKDIKHPAIEAVFTTDEEIGMVGALKLNFEKLKGRKMINIDSEDPEVVTVSCAGGSDFKIITPVNRLKKNGDIVKITVKGLTGGHSGVKINSGRVNANILMARLLNYINRRFNFEIISVNGGDKANAIPVSCKAEILAENSEELIKELKAYGETIKKEIACREPDFALDIQCENGCEADVIVFPEADQLVYLLLGVPNGVVEMSAEISGLVETSLNLGILKTTEEHMTMLFALRSNKQSALSALEEKLATYAEGSGCDVETGGHYPPWEYNPNSELEKLYKAEYEKKFGKAPKTEAIHAGLECGVFASEIDGFDCISIGPEMHDIHTTSERLSISSTKDTYEILLNILKA